jgi:hypothetical protein
MNKEQQELVGDAYKSYENKYYKGEAFGHKKLNDSEYSPDLKLSQEEFINKCKTDIEFSEKWGLTIEERELSWEERLDLLKKLEIFQERVIDNAKSEMIHSLADSHNIPTKLITIKYNDKKIESYE